MQEMVDRVFTKITNINEHHIYLTGDLLVPSHYMEEFQLIRNMGPEDTTILHINGLGGHTSTSIQFVRCMEETEGTVIASVEGDCMSAYTTIFLKAHAWEVSDNSVFMVHSYSEGFHGKSSDIVSKVSHDIEWFKEFALDIYSPFLSEKELDDMLAGKELYFKPQEVMDRCEKVLKARQDASRDNLPDNVICLEGGLLVDEELYDKVVEHYLTVVNRDETVQGVMKTEESGD